MNWIVAECGATVDPGDQDGLSSSTFHRISFLQRFQGYPLLRRIGFVDPV